MLSFSPYVCHEVMGQNTLILVFPPSRHGVREPVERDTVGRTGAWPSFSLAHLLLDCLCPEAHRMSTPGCRWSWASFLWVVLDTAKVRDVCTGGRMRGCKFQYNQQLSQEQSCSPKELPTHLVNRLSGCRGLNTCSIICELGDHSLCHYFYLWNKDNDLL